MMRRLAHKPILLSVGLLMSAVVVLAVVSMISSVHIAQTNEGMATAINQSGSLRMQSYRIGVALADESVPASERAIRAQALATEFEERLESPRLVNAIPGGAQDEVTDAYQRVTSLWHRAMKPPLEDYIRLLTRDASPGRHALPRAGYLAGVDAFVAQIDALVRLLEDVAEHRIQRLRTIQGISLALTIVIVVLTMGLVIRRVIRPLGDLLACADRARQGDFSGRTRFTDNDELGRLGAAMNLMAADLSRMYAELERRVEEKTRDLARTNHSLELLYRTSKTLNEAPVSEPLLRQVLLDIQHDLNTGPSTLCLRDQDREGAGTLVVTTRPETGQESPCRGQGCRACENLDGPRKFQLDLTDGSARRFMSFPVADKDQRFGVLLVDQPDAADLEPWQQRLLLSLAEHIGTAINLQHRMRESRRLVLHEERGIIARELHDSLAQSLSYLKIQVTRLSAALNDPSDKMTPQGVLEELREGINSAYRQLRELLTTFRLKMDDRGLKRALEDTVQEFRVRSTVKIMLDNRLPSSLLTPNEEIHVLQIVREALSNVVRHAKAQHARVTLQRLGDSVEVEVSDDGRGIDPRPGRAHHYGMTIMRERSESLNGELSMESAPAEGTRVQLRFRHRTPVVSNNVSAAMLGAAS